MERKRIKGKDTPIAFMLTNLDFNSDGEFELIYNFHKKMKEENKDKEFNKKAVINWTKLELLGKESVDELFKIIESEGVESVLERLKRGEKSESRGVGEINIDKIADRIVEKLVEKGVNLSKGKEEKSKSDRVLTKEENEALDKFL